MTYPIENFYPGIDTPASCRHGMGLAGFAASVADAISTALAHYETFRRERATVRQLSMLDDTTLRDIGLDRGQIASAARSAAVAQQAKEQR